MARYTIVEEKTGGFAVGVVWVLYRFNDSTQWEAYPFPYYTEALESVRDFEPIEFITVHIPMTTEYLIRRKERPEAFTPGPDDEYKWVSV